MLPNLLAMYCKTSNSLTNYTFMFKYRFTPPNVGIRSMQAKQLSLLFCRQGNNLYTFNVLLLNTPIYTKHFHP